MAGVCAWLSGCVVTMPPADAEPDSLPPADVVSEPGPVEDQRREGVAVEPALAIIVGVQYAQFRPQSYVFAARLGRPYRLYELSARSPRAVLEDLQRLRPDRVIALGPDALRLAAQLPQLSRSPPPSVVQEVDLVYAGVLHPDAQHRGVQALPPFTLQLDYWRSIVPNLQRIGVIGGRDSRERVEEIARACETAGVQLDHREVASDREMLLAFRSILPHIDGFVLLPDPEILSPEVIRRTIGHGVVNDLPILVYSPLMYELGASLLVEAEPVDVALQIIALLDSKETSRALTKLQTRSQTARPTVAFDG